MTPRQRSGALAAAVTAATLIPLAAFGGVGLAKSGPSASQYQYRVTICHRTHSKKHPMHTITVSQAALKAHLRHGDTLGACPAPTTPAASTTAHGKSSGHHGKP